MPLAFLPKVVYLKTGFYKFEFMKTVALLLAGMGVLLASHARAEQPAQGSLMELHSCELYAGGCIVSSESTLGGRYMVRAWNFKSGTQDGAPLAGLTVAVLQSSPENLAEPKSVGGDVVVYLPKSANPQQQQALVAWLKQSQPDLRSASLRTRIVPLHFSSNNGQCELTAGDFISVSTAPLETCETGACGEALWYTPRTQNQVFTVAVDRVSQVREPMLKLRWRDAGKRSVFLAKFGEAAGTGALYVSSAELCGATGKLF